MARSEVKDQGHQGQKNEKLLVIPIDNACAACAVGRTQQAATDDTVGIITSQQTPHGYARGS